MAGNCEGGTRVMKVLEIVAPLLLYPHFVLKGTMVILLKRLRNASWKSRKENARENKRETDQQFHFIFLSQRAQLSKQQTVLSLHTRESGGRVNSLFSLIPFHHIRVALVTKCVCSGGGCPLNRQEPSCFRWSCLWCSPKHGPGTQAARCGGPRASPCCAVLLIPKQLAGFTAEASTTHS